MKLPSTKGAFVLNSSLPTYVGIATLALCIVALLYVANWGAMHTSISKTPLDYSDPDAYAKQINAMIAASERTIPTALRDELAHSNIYFMFANKGSIYTRPYVLSSGVMASAPLDGAQPEYVSSSRDGKNLAFFAVSPGREGLDIGWHIKAQGYVYNTSDLAGKAFPASDLDESKVATKEGVSLKQLLSVSNTGAVLFTGWGGEAFPGIEPASSWSIYYANGTSTDMIASGYMAKWLNNIEFIYLASDGIYLKNVRTGAEDRLVAADSTVYNTNSIDISDDGKTLVWLRPEINQVTVYNIDPDTSALTASGVITARSFWGTISPSGSFVALETIQAGSYGNEASAKPKIEFFDLTSLDKIPGFSLPLDPFEPLYISMTDWARNN